MKPFICPTLRGYQKRNLPHDLLAGLIIAAVSIPISMGYAQIAGLPAVYGLYGSVFPILIFGLFSTSPQFIFGVDAAPAAMVGAGLLTLGVGNESPEALAIVPVLTLFTAIWLLLFSIFKLGKLVNYISSPVMGGFISGICCTIILMQLPKLIGGTAGTGELFELLKHLAEACSRISLPSFALGAGALVILLISKKCFPKFPMAVVLMAAGAVLSLLVPLKESGIMLLSVVEPGLPKFHLPQLSAIGLTKAIGMSLPVAIVIMAETLLAEHSFALKNGDKLEDNREILAFSLGNFAAAFTGCCPMNGSVSRTAMGEQYGSKTQLTGMVAGILMVVILLFFTGFIGYLPVPILTAIVISALMGACEFHLAKRLWKVSRKEFYIFCGAFLGVLLLGTIYGVLIGVILSFASVVLGAADPPRCFLGISPGQDEFFDSSRFRYIYPVEHVVLYRFSSNLFFANIGIFQRDIEGALTPDTKVVVVDCGGVGSIDVSAAERLEILYQSLKKRGIRFYLTEHISAVNTQLCALGIGHLIEEGAVRRTIEIALRDAGISKPYPLVGAENQPSSLVRNRVTASVQEFVWAFGERAEKEIEKQIHTQMELLAQTGKIEAVIHGVWNQMDSVDEDEWMEHLEAHLDEIAKYSNQSEREVAQKLEQHRRQIEEKLAAEHPELVERFRQRKLEHDEHLRKNHPEIHEKIIHLREEMKLL